MAAGLTATALALGACGAITNHVTPVASQAQPLTLALDGPPDATHVGIYEAVAGGELSRAGLTLHIEPTADPQRSLSLVESGRVDVAIVPEPELMLSRDHGSTSLGIAAVVQRPTSSVVTIVRKHEHITSIAGLRGKRVGVTGVPYESGLLRAALAHAGVPARSVHEVDVGSDAAAALLGGRVDAVYGGDSAALAAALRARHKRVTSLSLSRAGVPDYDPLVFVTRLVYFANNQNILRRFVQAIGRGYAAVRTDPATGVQALHSADPSLNPTIQAAAVKSELSSFFPTGGRPWGWQDQHEWNVFGRWMTAQRLISGPRGWVSASTNNLLAGQGP